MPETNENGTATQSRRSLFTTLSKVAMFGSLFAGYGLFAGMAGRFLFPTKSKEDRWTFLAEKNRLKPGESMIYTTPGGAPVNVARMGKTGTVEDFVALSSTCPHLGCQVFWEPQNDRFFCPCHSGAFNKKGDATAGPPLEAKQSLKPYPLKVEGDLLFVELPHEMNAPTVAKNQLVGAPPGPGHDPCLYVSRRRREKA